MRYHWATRNVGPRRRNCVPAACIEYTEEVGCVPESSDGPTVLRILLGSHLRRLRESRGITARQAAGKIRASESKISRIELVRNPIREIDVLDLLTLYGVDPREREQLLSLAEQWKHAGS